MKKFLLVTVILCMFGWAVFFFQTQQIWENDSPSTEENAEINIRIKDDRQPNLPEFTLWYNKVLPPTLPCAQSEKDQNPTTYLCASTEYREMAPIYEQFIHSVKLGDMENAWKMGKKLWPYLSGFNGDKYRVHKGSLIAITFGPQSWGDVLFETYTVLDDTIVNQNYTINASDYNDWEEAIVQKFQMKSFDDIYNGSIPPEWEKWQNIMKYANEYWYERFMKTPIQ